MRGDSLSCLLFRQFVATFQSISMSDLLDDFISNSNDDGTRNVTSYGQVPLDLTQTSNEYKYDMYVVETLLCL